MFIAKFSPLKKWITLHTFNPLKTQMNYGRLEYCCTEVIVVYNNLLMTKARGGLWYPLFTHIGSSDDLDGHWHAMLRGGDVYTVRAQ